MPANQATALGARPLDALLSRIEALFSADRAPDAAALAAALAGPLDPSALAPWVRFAEDRYARNLVARGEGWELRLLCWAPGQSSALHGHGASACAFRVISGTAEELRLGAGRRLLPAGAIAMAGEEDVHQVGNRGPEALVTLHLYAPALPVDQPSSAEGRRIVVIGGGFCGAALAVHLLARGGPELRITLVERGPEPGRGVAYGTRDAAHLLNVPAARMSLDPADPEGFLRFAHARGLRAGPMDLLPRALYGEYVSAALAEAIQRSPGRLRVAAAEAVDVEPEGVRLDDGRLLPAEVVVLASGHLPPRWPEGIPEEIRRDPRVVRDAWDPGAIESVGPFERVLVVGTGLTAVDVLLSLRGRGHRGGVIATSRGGRWPEPHLPGVAWTGPAPRLDPASAPREAEGLTRWFRAAVEEARGRGLPWQAVLDAMRPHIPTLWGALSTEERAIFLARYRSRWELLRHRAPVSSLAALGAWQEEGGLEVQPGELVGGRAEPDALRLELRQGEATRTLAVDRLVLCTGADTDVRNAANPVLRALLARGRVVSDPLGLGLEVDPEGRALDLAGRPDPRLWVLGAARRPRLWETTAVPELARQAAALAAALVPVGAARGA